MLLGMSHSSGDQWKLEQLWIIWFLTDELVSKKKRQIGQGFKTCYVGGMSGRVLSHVGFTRY